MNWCIESLTGQTCDHLVKLDGHLVHVDVKADVTRLRDAAKEAGFDLTIASSFRDFNRQCLIWNNKFSGFRPILDNNGNILDPNLLNDEEKIRAILRWSALPGASRHHWGTDIDVYAINLLPEEVALQLEPWEYLSGHQAPFFTWLEKNLGAYGFYFPYRTDRGGVGFEPWHISHIHTSMGLFNELTVEKLREVIVSSDIEGRETVLTILDWIYIQYVSNVSEV